jgi:hypothetical protein
MRACFHVLAVAALLLSALGIPGDVLAGKSLTGSKELVVPGEANDPIAPLATVLSSGFEAGDGFALGALEPQGGWTASGTNAPWASISNLNPFAGAQHLRLANDPAVAGGSARVFLSPPVVVAPLSPSQVKEMIYISNDGGADYDLIGQAPSQGFITWRVKFHYTDLAGTGPGTIFILDDLGAGLVFVDTGVLWAEGSYRELKVQFDPAAAEIRYFYDGVLIYTGSIYAGTAVEQVGGLHDNFQLANENAGVDGLIWIDTPSDPVPTRTTSWGGIKGLYR